MPLLERWKNRARQLKVETYTLYLAYRDPRTPWYAKLFSAVVVGYAFSPIDLIPDFIPVLGYLDDLILVPLGIMLALKLIPRPVMIECREKALSKLGQDKPSHWIVGLAVLLIWVLVIATIIRLSISYMQNCAN